MDYLARLEAVMAARFDDETMDLVTQGSRNKCDASEGEEEVCLSSDFEHSGVSDDDFDENDSDGDEIEESEDLEESEESEEEIIAKQPAVVVFQDPSARSKSTSISSKAAYKAFMSSSISKMDPDAVSASKKEKMTEEEAEQEMENKRNDVALMELLQSSKLMEEYDKSEFASSNRHYLHDTYEVKKIKVPLNIRFGMERKAKERREKRIQEAKDLGLYNEKTKHLYKDERTKIQEQKKVKASKSSRGLHGSIGKYKNGVLHVSKKDIEAVNGPSGKNKSGGKNKKKITVGFISNKVLNGLGGDHRKRKSASSGNKGKKKARR